MKKIVFSVSITVICTVMTATAQATEPNDSVSGVYELGTVEVWGNQSYNLTTDKIGSSELQRFNRENLQQALSLLPGISLSEAGGRNEGSFYLRGFNMLQTPIFYDGVPIYVPYDGNVDINRFLTFDLSRISVSKGFTSILYGPNTLSGAINMVSRKPVEKFEIRGTSGIGYSKEGMNGYHSVVNIGTKAEKYYFLGSLSFMDTRFTNLSADMEPGDNEDGGKREQSAMKDFKFSVKGGYTPNATDEYSFNFIIQDASKNIPPPTNGTVRFWDYPVYDKKSLYYRSRTKLGNKVFMNAVVFYDSYYNILDSYDDNTYTLQNLRRAFHSIYDDYSLGGSVNIATEFIPRHKLSFVLYEKYDSHKEQNGEIPENSETGQQLVEGEPIQRYLDNTFSVGVEDIFHLNEKMNLIGGLSYNYRENIQAQEYGTHYLTGEEDVLYDFPTGSDGAFNYQLAVEYMPLPDHKITLSASRKSRFASQKERYSSAFGSQVPNPGLQSEFTWAFDLNYSARIASVLQMDISLYRNNIDNAIYRVTQGMLDDGTPVSQNQNVGKSVFQGFETAFGVQPVRWFNFGIHYSYLHMENKDDKELKFTNVPSHTMIAYTEFRLTGWDAYLHIDMETNGKRYITSDGETLPGFTLVNAKVSSKIIQGINMEVGVRNLFDKNYFLVSTSYPREGRSFFTSLVYNF